MACGLLLQFFWICALLFNGCLSTPKDYRYRSQNQNQNIGDDADDDRFISPGSELEDRDPKPAARYMPPRGSAQQNVQSHPGGQAVAQLNRVAQGSAANEPLVFPLVGPAHSQLGAVNQQSAASGFTNVMPPSSSGFSGYAPQGWGQSQFVSDSRAPEAKGLVFEEVFHLLDSGPSQHYGAGRGYDYGQNSLNFGSHGSTLDANIPFYQRYSAQSAGPSGVAHGHLAHANYNEGLNSHRGETHLQRADAQVVRPPPPPPPPANLVYLTRSRHGYSRARYSHSHSNYSPDLDAPMPVMSVDPQPRQDVPVKDTHRPKW